MVKRIMVGALAVTPFVAQAAVDADLSAIVGDTTGLFGTVKVLAITILVFAVGYRIIRRFAK